MNDIIIFGTGKTREVVETGLNENVNIIAYLDNNHKKWGTELNSKYILQPDKIKDMNYDYVIIASQYNDAIYNQLLSLEVDNDKIFQYNLFCMFKYNSVEAIIRYLLRDSPEKTQMLITGISYTQKAIKTGEFYNRAFSFACASQDLFYDFNIIKWLLKNHKLKLTNLKYVLIGMSYYSFQYDLSLSSLKYRTLLYYDAIGILHNFKDVDDILRNKNNTMNIAKEIFKFNSNGTVQIDWMLNKENIYTLDEHKGKIQAEIDCNKNYPETVKENIRVFDEYLNLLEEYNIKPIVMIAPVSKYYSKYFSKRIKDEFMEIINERKDRFQFIDYFDSKLFDDSDFFDVSHLNPNGATKFTKILNDIIEW